MVEQARRFSAPADGRLTDAMREAWEEDGFLVLEGFVDPAECDSLRAHTNALLKDFDPGSIASIFSTTDQSHRADSYFQESGDKISFFFEEEAFDDNGALKQDKTLSINKLGHAMHDLDPTFSAFSRGEKLAALAEDIGFTEPKLLQSMYIFKQPHIGGEVTCHQDSTFIYTDPLSCVGFWFALEDATEDNGAMYAIPGAHKQPLKQRFHYDESGEKLTFTDLAEAEWPDRRVLLDASKGTLVLLHGSLPHQSGANRSEKSRHAYTLHVIDGAAEYPTDNWLRRRADLPLTGFAAHA